MAALRISPSHADTQTSLRFKKLSQSDSPTVNTSNEYCLHSELKKYHKPSYLLPTHLPLENQQQWYFMVFKICSAVVFLPLPKSDLYTISTSHH